MKPASLQTICKLLMLTERRVQQLAKEKVLVKVSSGKYDLVASIQGYIKYIRDDRLRVADDSPSSIDAIRKEKLQVELDNAKIDLLIKRQEYAPISAFEEVLNNIFSVFRSRLLGMPSKLAPRLAGQDKKKAKDLLNKAVREALDELSATDTKALLG